MNRFVKMLEQLNDEERIIVHIVSSEISDSMKDDYLTSVEIDENFVIITLEESERIISILLSSIASITYEETQYVVNLKSGTEVRFFVSK